MTDSEPVKVKPYVPFPMFEAWVASSVDLHVFDDYCAQLHDLKISADEIAIANAIDVATRWAAIDTGAIEGLYEVERGFTISMAVSGAVLDSIHAMKGEEVARAVGDALDAYDFVLDIATNSRPVTEVWIRELHAKICKSQVDYVVATSIGPQHHELERGKYKSLPNSPYNFDSREVHSYAPVIDTPSEMARLIEVLRSDEFLRSNPAIQAAYAHYAFVCIHPFADGNGRVSRALASAYLYREPGLPLVIFADQKGTYISALEAADSGDYASFIRFMADRVVDTVGMVKTTIEAAVAPTFQDQVKALEAMLTGRGGLEHKELDLVALRLVESFEVAALAVGSEQFGSGRVNVAVQRTQGGSVEKPEGYRLVPGNSVGLLLNLSIDSPANASVGRGYSLVVAKPDVDAPDFLLLRGERVLVEAYIREMTPEVSGAVKFRLKAAAEGQFRELLAEVTEKAMETLRNAGYAP